MADFKTRIDDLTGFGSTDDVAIVDWLTAGAREIIDVLPMSKLDRMSEIQAFTGNVNVEDSKILHVLRKDENKAQLMLLGSQWRDVSRVLESKEKEVKEAEEIKE